MAAASTSRRIEVTVLSGEDLRLDRKPIKKNAFVIVRTETGDFRSSEIDKEGGSFPAWKEKLFLDLPAHARAMTLEVHCKASSGSRLVGTAMVPLSDFSGGFVPASYLHFLSYRLRDSRGEKNGIINISVRMTVHGGGGELHGCSSSSETIGVPIGGTGFGGVVTGVPVWCAYSTTY